MTAVGCFLTLVVVAVAVVAARGGGMSVCVRARVCVRVCACVRLVVRYSTAGILERAVDSLHADVRSLLISSNSRRVVVVVV